VAEDVEHVAVRVAHEEAADTPRLVGQGMHDLAAEALSGLVRSIDVVDLDRRVRLH
jgi:hypothetical protein